jgi:hypothetical protein
MKEFLIAQTALNLFAAVVSKQPIGRLFCLAFGLWGGTAYVLNYWH